MLLLVIRVAKQTPEGLSTDRAVGVYLAYQISGIEYQLMNYTSSTSPCSLSVYQLIAIAKNLLLHWEFPMTTVPNGII